MCLVFSSYIQYQSTSTNSTPVRVLDLHLSNIELESSKEKTHVRKQVINKFNQTATFFSFLFSQIKSCFPKIKKFCFLMGSIGGLSNSIVSSWQTKTCVEHMGGELGLYIFSHILLYAKTSNKSSTFG